MLDCAVSMRIAQLRICLSVSFCVLCYTCEKPPVFVLQTICCFRDSSGYTPFMFAVAHRAYPAALAIFKAAFSLAIDAPAGGNGAQGRDY